MDRGAWGATVQRVAELDTTEQLGTHKHPFVISYMWILKMQQSSELKIHSQM